MNPFTVLGITAAAVRGLKDEETATLVKAMHRALSMIHHPDRGGKQAKFRELQEALEEVDWAANPEQFRYWRQQLLRTPKQQLADLDRERSLAKHRQRTAEDGLLDYAKAATGIAELPEGSRSICGLDHVRILIYETLVNTLVHRQNPTSLALDKYQSCCELEVVSGEITRYEALTQTFSESTPEDMPPHPTAWGHKGRKKNTRDVCIRAKRGDVLRGMRIIGAIPREVLDNSDTDGPRGLTPLLMGHEDAEQDLSAVKAGYDWDAFRRFGSLMKPYLKEQDELVYSDGHRFIPVGRIRGICAIRDWPLA